MAPLEIFTQDGIFVLLRWVHIMAGVVWIGLLYYFNFVQAPAFAEFDAESRSVAIRKLVPRALKWFRYSALITFLAGLLFILLKIRDAGVELLSSDYGVVILSGMGLGTLMFLNVWGVIWPKQKIVIASAEKVAGGGEADPLAADSGRRALLASRTNVVFSIPMLFFMASSGHLTQIAQGTGRASYGIVATVLVLAIELNALTGLTGSSKKPLEKVGTVILYGFFLYAILYLALETLS